MATIYLIRHGQASFGQENYDQLSALGERQAGALGEYLRDCAIQLDAIYSGDLERQVRTAALVASLQPQQVEHQIDPRFNEIRNDEQVARLAPELARTNPALNALLKKEVKSSKDYQKIIEAVFSYWVSDQCTAKDIQSWSDYSSRVSAALKSVIEEQGSGKSVAIFTSGGTIATIVSQVLGLDSSHAYKFYEPVINCSVTQLFYSRSRVSLSYFNDHSFLDLIGRAGGESLVTYR